MNIESSTGRGFAAAEVREGAPRAGSNGSSAFCLGRITFRSQHGQPMPELLEHHLPFVMQPPADGDQTVIEVRWRYDERLHTGLHGNDLRLDPATGELASPWARGSLVAASGGRTLELSLLPTARAFSSMITACAALLIQQLGGFILHSATGVHQGLAYVFVGPSGAGKTTSLNMGECDGWLAHDVVAVMPRGDDWEAFGLPGGHPSALAQADHRVYPVGAVIRLARERLPRGAVEQLSPSSAVFRLRECAQALAGTDEGDLLDSCASLAASIPVLAAHPDLDATLMPELLKMTS